MPIQAAKDAVMGLDGGVRQHHAPFDGAGNQDGEASRLAQRSQIIRVAPLAFAS
jgi:hypothetical protein